ncbi:MAG: MFS transporter [Hyphomicrobiales bacterium]|nr:MFS transporter [Hyphomicrobiales bacterium]
MKTHGGEKSNWRNLIAACSAISVFGITFGMTLPLLSLILESRGVAEGMIGVNAAMSPIGVLLFSPVIPVAAQKFGAKPTAIVAALLTALVIPCYKIFPSLEAWFVLRLVHGMLISTLFVLSESWIVKFANGKHRGRIVAIYASVLSASFATGPAVVGWIGIEGWWPFIIGTCVLLLGTLPLFLVIDKPGEMSEEPGSSSFFAIAPRAPMLLASVATFAVFDAATLSLMAVYAVRTGLDLATAAYTLTALIAGNIFLQYPIGWLADRVAKRAVLAGCAFLTLLLLLLVPHVMGGIWMWPVLILAGSTGYGMYTVALAALGDRFDGDELIAGMAAFSVMWGTGALAGATIAGWAMSGFGPHGLPYMLAAIYAAYLIAMAVRSSTRN